jgi:hypothetical protein
VIQRDLVDQRPEFKDATLLFRCESTQVHGYQVALPHQLCHGLLPGAFNGKTLVALACEAGDTFGRDVQAAGASGFLGFDEALVVVDAAVVNSNHFEDAVVSGAHEILHGRTAADAGRRMKDLFKDAHDFFKTGGEERIPMLSSRGFTPHGIGAVCSRSNRVISRSAFSLRTRRFIK